MADEPKATSHAEALKSTSIIGGSTVMVMAFRIVRTKALAILLGPTGVGLEGIFDSALSVAKTLVDLGVSSSGVRQIAAAVGSGDQRLVATTVTTLRRTCLVLGVIGAAGFYLARDEISQSAFGNAEHGRDFGLLALILLFGALAGGQGALLQGMRRIGDLAKMNVIGAIAGAVLSIPIVYVWGRDGIVAYMIAGALVAVLASSYYARRVKIAPAVVTLPQIRSELAGLLKLGLVFVSTGLMSTGALFLIRTFVTRQEGLVGTGQFQAASALSTVYVGFVLQAMGTDFYPRLTAVSTDNERCNQLVNEQAEISILLALPGILATLAAAPWVIRIFYTGSFELAAVILCWQVTGMFFQVNSWPMGFIIVAKGRAAAMFWTDLASYSLYAGLAWLGLKRFGLPGVGMAFLGLYIFHWGVMYAIARRVSGFRWTPANTRLSALGLIASLIALVARLNLAEPWATLVGGMLAAIAGVFCLRALIRHAGPEKIKRLLSKLGARFGLRDQLKPSTDDDRTKRG
jgi:PST family polysaccharide transporter